MSGGVRPGIWALAGAALLACGALLRWAPAAPSPSQAVERGAAPPGTRRLGPPAAPAAAADVAAPAAAMASVPVARAAPIAEPAPVSDAKDDAALAVAEEAASRLAERLRVPGLETIDARVALLPPLPGEDPASHERRQDELRRRLSADLLLEEYLARLDYQSTLYPPDYPIERVREAARSELRRLRGEARVAILDEALDGVAGLDASPHFTSGAPSLATNDAP